MSFKRFIEHVGENLAKNARHAGEDATALTKIREGALHDVESIVRGVKPADIVKKEASIRADMNTIFLREQVPPEQRRRIMDAVLDAAKNPKPEAPPVPSNRTTAAATDPRAQSSSIINPATGRPFEAADRRAATGAAQPPQQPPRGGNPVSAAAEPPPAPRGPQTEAEKMADTLRIQREGREAENLRSFQISRFGTRKDISDSIVKLGTGSIAERKAAFEMLDKSIGSAGYINDAAQAGVNPRTTKEVGDILRTQHVHEVEKVITRAEYDAFRRESWLGILQDEVKDINVKISKVKAGGGVMEDAHASFSRLIEIMRDKDYVAKFPLEGAAKDAHDNGTVRAISEIEKDLRAGKTLGDGELTTLYVRYARQDKDVINALALKTMSADRKTFLTVEEVAAFRTTLLKNNQLDLHGAKTGLKKEDLAAHLNDGKPLSAADFDRLVVKDQSSKRPVKLSVPGGKYLGMEGVEVPKWLRNTAVIGALGYFGLVNVPGGDSVDGGIAGAMYKGAVAWNQGKITAGIEKDVAEVKAGAAEKKAAQTKQEIAEGNVAFLREAAGGSPEVGTDRVEKAIEDQYMAGSLSAQEMEQLTTRLTQISATRGNQTSLDAEERKQLTQDAAFKNLKPAAQAALKPVLEP